MKVKTWAHAAIGKVRERQEDALLVQLPLLALADGMGGMTYGGASSQALIASLGAQRPRTFLQLLDRVRLDDAKLHGQWRSECGTTLDAVLLGEEVIGVHAGDARVYWGRRRGRAGSKSYSLAPVTRDHGHGNYLDNFVGSGHASFDPITIPWLKGDYVVLCSDGLTGELTDAQISAVLWSSTRNPARALVRKVLGETPARDNVSVIVAKRLA